MLSQLALNASFKDWFFEGKTPVVQLLTKCICAGVWGEVREAVACIANLCWNPSNLVCWLKFDSPYNVGVDAACVLLPVISGKEYTPVGIGQGLYRSHWGTEFIGGTGIVLHPDGVSTHQVPSTLTNANLSDSFLHTSTPFLYVDPPDPRDFTVTCWVRAPFPKGKKRVLLQSHPRTGKHQILFMSPQGEWMITDEVGRIHAVRRVPTLRAGWHFIALQSSEKGVQFIIDDCVWPLAEKVYVTNNFHGVGADVVAKEGSFGAIADFRIYNITVPEDDLLNLPNLGINGCPDFICRNLYDMGVHYALPRALTVPDCAVECLRCYGSLATYEKMRGPVFSLCGYKAVQMLDSPMPMVQRQAARLLNNLR
jgi:hypothetical protein